MHFFTNTVKLSGAAAADATFDFHAQKCRQIIVNGQAIHDDLAIDSNDKKIHIMHTKEIRNEGITLLLQTLNLVVP